MSGILHFKEEACELVAQIAAILNVDATADNEKNMLIAVNYANAVLTRVADASYDQGVEDGPVDYA